jgi:hypothetical protein
LLELELSVQDAEFDTGVLLPDSEELELAVEDTEKVDYGVTASTVVLLLDMEELGLEPSVQVVEVEIDVAMLTGVLIEPDEDSMLLLNVALLLLGLTEADDALRRTVEGSVGQLDDFDVGRDEEDEGSEVLLDMVLLLLGLLETDELGRTLEISVGRLDELDVGRNELNDVLVKELPLLIVELLHVERTLELLDVDDGQDSLNVESAPRESRISFMEEAYSFPHQRFD